MTGKIIKGIAGAYYVHVVGFGIYECKAKGIFRHKNIKPLVGDNVEIDVLDEKEMTGNIIEIYDRTNELIRPAVANIDQALVVFAVKSPMPNLNLLDRFLVMMESQDVPTIICFNKVDLVKDEELLELKNIYSSASYEVVFASAANGYGVDVVKEKLKNKTTSLAGPSGVGKSSMINALIPDVFAKTGDISRKIERGKHTTRHSEIMNVEEDTYIMDTPGFSSMDIPSCKKEDLKMYFPEIYRYEGECRFNGCIHIGEPDCKVKENVATGIISKSRYENYKILFDEIKSKRKY